MISELEAKSIDFLDIAFQLEKIFRLIPRGSIEKAREGTKEDGLQADGTLTQAR